MSLALSGYVTHWTAHQPDAETPAFTDRPRAARFFIGAVIAAGLGALFLQPPGASYAHPAVFLALLSAAAVASVFKVELPLSHHGATMSLSFAFEFASLLMLGTHATMVIAASSAWVQCTAARGQRNPLHRTAFSMAALVVTSLGVGAVFQTLGGRGGWNLTTVGGGLESPAIVAATSYFVLNTLLVASAVSLETSQPFRKVWNEHAVWSALGYVVGAGAAAAGSALYETPNAGLIPVVLIPLYLIHRTYGLYFDRVDTEQGRVREMSDLHLATVEALALAIDAKDQTATSSIRRVRTYAAGMGQAMGMSEPDVQGLRTAALLHDIGKLAVPEHILSKPGPLTQEEFQRMQVHPQVGAEIIAHVPFPYPVAPIIQSHHERWDGKGYPSGLSGQAIPFGARILAAVDYFDALSSDPPFHEALSRDEALEQVKQEAGKAFDLAVVETLVRLMPQLEASAALEIEPAHPVRLQSRRKNSSGAVEAPQKNVLQDIALAHREIHALYEIAQSMGTSLGVADTMALVASKLSNLVPLKACALFLHEESGDLLRCRFATGVDAELLQTLVVQHGDGLVGWVGRNHRPLVNARPAADLEAAGVNGVTSLMSALVFPLLFDDRLIGTLAVYHTEQGCYTDDHRRLLDRVAEQAAGVINNSVVFEQTKRDSLTDPLTGQPNTRFMFVPLTRELARAERLGSEMSLLVMDLDGFKEINDCHGHHVGDRALREVARVLRNGTGRTTSASGTRATSSSWCSRAAAPPTPIRSAGSCSRPSEDIPFEVPGPLPEARELVRLRGVPARRRGVRVAPRDGRKAHVSGQERAQGAQVHGGARGDARQAAVGVC